MFDFSAAPGPVRDDIVSGLQGTWEHLARPGTWWNADQRRQIAETARAARMRLSAPATDLPDAAVATSSLLAATPAQTSETWVGEMVAALGEEQYVEILGITTRVVAADTFLRLLGSPAEPFLDPEPGQPSEEAVEPRLQRIRSWIAVGNTLAPPFTQALVPSENAATNRLVHALYMTDEEMDDPDFRRGDLHRTQIEVAASTLSHSNECFY